MNTYRPKTKIGIKALGGFPRKANMTLKNDIETKCDCCGWDDYGYQHEPYCSALKDEPEEPVKKKALKSRIMEGVEK